jgi:hypothetical protein
LNIQDLFKINILSPHPPPPRHPTDHTAPSSVAIHGRPSAARAAASMPRPSNPPPVMRSESIAYDGEAI